MIADDLRPLVRPIGDLHPLPGNPRKGDVEAVMRSYDQFGQRKPIVALRDGTVIAGNHQLQAAKLLGWDEIAVVYVDDDDTTAKAFALADNRIADLGKYDTEALTQMLTTIAIDDDLLRASGYSHTDLKNLADSLTTPDTFDPEPIPDLPDPYNLDTEYRCPNCGTEWTGSPKPGTPPPTDF